MRIIDPFNFFYLFEINFVSPQPEKPLLDSAEPKELNTPNNGAGVEIIGEFIVKGSETLSRAINAVLDASIKWMLLFFFF